MEKVTFDFSKLRGKIKEEFQSETNFSEKAKVSKSSLSAKLNNKAYFNPSEIVKFSGLLNIPDEEVKTYFFTLEVRKTENKQLINQKGAKHLNEIALSENLEILTDEILSFGQHVNKSYWERC